MADNSKITGPPPPEPASSNPFLSLPVEHSVKHEDYLIEEEFRKTRKNRSSVTVLLFLLLAGLLGLGSYFLSLNVERQSGELQTNIRDFQNIQLRELLNIINALRDSISRVEQERILLEQELSEAIIVLDRNYQSRLDLLEGTEEEVLKQQAALQGSNRREISALRAEYEMEFVRLDGELIQLRAELSQYDSGLSDTQAEDQNFSRDRLRSLEIQRLTDSYESRIASLRVFYGDQLSDKDQLLNLVENRYNPVFKDNTLRELLVAEPEISPVIPNAQVHKSVEPRYEDLWTYYQYTEKLVQRLQKIPYEGDVDKSLKSIELYQTELVRSYEDIIQDLSQRLRDMEQLQTQYRHSFDSFIGQFREDGIILDARDSERILIHLNAFVQAFSGQMLYVFRGEVLSAVLILLPLNEHGQQYARLHQELIADPVQAYDRILLQTENVADTNTDTVSEALSVDEAGEADEFPETLVMETPPIRLENEEGE